MLCESFLNRCTQTVVLIFRNTNKRFHFLPVGVPTYCTFVRLFLFHFCIHMLLILFWLLARLCLLCVLMTLAFLLLKTKILWYKWFSGYCFIYIRMEVYLYNICTCKYFVPCSASLPKAWYYIYFSYVHRYTSTESGEIRWGFICSQSHMWSTQLGNAYPL